MTNLHSTKSRRQRGFSLIESLVALVVAALGILGILGVQMRTLTDTQTSVRRAQAVRLIEDLGERMKVNPNALMILGSYTSTWGATPPTGTDCGSAICNAADLAAYDLAQWKQLVRNTLQSGDANIFLASGETDATNRRQLGVMISWRENERDGSTAFKNDIDATQVRAADGSLSAGATGADVCPNGFTCHLQYIPVAARCAPYFAGGPVQYYCPGA